MNYVVSEKKHGEIYNSELKNEFIKEYNEVTGNEYNEHTAKTYYYDLIRISGAETFYKKNIFEFTYEQLDDAFRSIHVKSIPAVNRLVSTVTQYIEWANRHGHVETKIDLASLFSGEKIKSYVWKHAMINSIITREELYDICDELVNPCDRALVVLPFEGIKGEGLREMIELTYDDIDIANNKVFIKSRNVWIDVDPRSIDIIMEAKDQDIYLKKNGNSISRVTAVGIFDSPYVVKKTMSNQNESVYSDDYGLATGGFIEAKFTRMFKPRIARNGVVIDDPYVTMPFLNINNIYKSGVFDHFYRIHVEKGGMTTEDYMSVCIRFGMSTDRWASYKNQYLHYRKIKG